MNTLELINQAYDELRKKHGPMYKSMMEGYGMTVAGLATVEAQYKDVRKSIRVYGDMAQHVAPDAQREALIGMLNNAARLTACAAELAGRMKLFVDTAIEQGGGDLIDMIDEEEYENE